MTRILVVDNHDSFVHTLAGYLVELGAEVDVVASDAVDPARDLDGVAGVLVSPGPGTPEHAGASVDVVRSAAQAALPLLGVCLGHQAIAVAFGARVAEAPELMHGITSAVHHDGRSIYQGLPEPFAATRYHSLAIVAETLPDDLRITSRTGTGVVMGVEHRTLPIVGVQFHPESVLTEGGYRLLGNWLATVGLVDAPARGAQLRPHRAVGSTTAGVSPSTT